MNDAILVSVKATKKSMMICRFLFLVNKTSLAMRMHPFLPLPFSTPSILQDYLCMSEQVKHRCDYTLITTASPLNNEGLSNKVSPRIR